MKNMRDIFGSLFGRERKPGDGDRPAASAPPQGANPQRPVQHAEQPSQGRGELYRKGDRIGHKFEVHSLIGRGGFGLVYLVYDRESGGVYALKTFRDEFLADPAVREAFKREALLWVALDEHPFILAARWVEEVSGRLFVQMDYVAPDEHGRMSLDDHFRQASDPVDLDQSLKWAIQFCLGMEHANTHGIKCHRDIKPSNILIAQDGTLKIADFGLAAAAEMGWGQPGGRGGSLISAGADGRFGLSLFQTEGKNRCGTPGYMAPEVYRGEGAGVRSDIYGFGLVLWQMATESPTPPFHVIVPHRGDGERYLSEYMEAAYQKQMEGKVPWVDGPLLPIIERCLAAEPSRRYSDFGQLRKDLEVLYLQRTGRTVEVPSGGEKTVAFWTNKGSSLNALGRHEEAIVCFDKALEIDPRRAAWNNKGISLRSLGRYDEAIACFDKALEIDPRCAYAWNNKGFSLHALGRYDEAIACFDKALEIDPRNAKTWDNKGRSLDSLGRYQEAIACHDKALEIDPRCASAWDNKGSSLKSINRHQEAIVCFDKALEINPRCAAWNGKCVTLFSLGRYQEVIACCDKALEIDPRHVDAWNTKGYSLDSLGRYQEAIACFDKALKINPRDDIAWYGKSVSLRSLGRDQEVIACCDKALEIDPRNAKAWNNKGDALKLKSLGRYQEAIVCYDKTLEINPRHADAWHNKGVSLFCLGRDQEAIACYDKALEIDPRNTNAWNNKALVEEAMGRVQAAIASWRRYLQLAEADPAQRNRIPKAKARLQKLERG